MRLARVIKDLEYLITMLDQHPNLKKIDISYVVDYNEFLMKQLPSE